jgi:hypothetical protein
VLEPVDRREPAGELDRHKPADVLDPVAELVRANERAGSRPDGWTASARWKTERHIPDHVLLGAMEAMG